MRKLTKKEERQARALDNKLLRNIKWAREDFEQEMNSLFDVEIGHIYVDTHAKMKYRLTEIYHTSVLNPILTFKACSRKFDYVQVIFWKELDDKGFIRIR